MAQHHLTLRIALFLTLPPLLWAGNAVVGRLLWSADIVLAIGAALIHLPIREAKAPRPVTAVIAAP